MTVFDSPDLEDHEHVAFVNDRQSGLRAIIAVHDTTLGPALGGCRMWPFASVAEALRDVLRLSRGMTYKNAMADLPLGGGKAVVLGDARRDKTDLLLAAFGRAVDSLDGRYVTAEDVGMSVADMERIGRETPHVSGRDRGASASGDPSPFTAYGVFVGIRAAVGYLFGSDSLAGRRVAVQGLGHVGSSLCRYLSDAGAELVVADVNPAAVRAIVEDCGAEAVAPESILSADVDVLAPCALGGVLNDESIPRLQAAIVAGAANNQLEAPQHGVALQRRGILYAPDYVINAGGVVNIAGELAGSYDPEESRDQIEQIGERLTGVFQQAASEKLPTHVVADRIAEEKLAKGRAALSRSTSDPVRRVGHRPPRSVRR